MLEILKNSQGDLLLVLNKYSLKDPVNKITKLFHRLTEHVVQGMDLDFIFRRIKIHHTLYSFSLTRHTDLYVHLRHLSSSINLYFFLYRLYLSLRYLKKKREEKEKKTTKRKEREEKQRNLGRSGEFFSSRRSFICLVPKKSNQGDLWSSCANFTFFTLSLFSLV